MRADVVMVSGGLDSCLAASGLPGAVQVFVEWGQPYLSMERAAVLDLYPSARTVRVEGLPNPSESDFYVPARNLMFATIGARFGRRVWLAGMRDEMCADKSPDAFRMMTSILTAQCKGAVEVLSPFWSRTKSEAVADYLSVGGDPGRLLRTVSCYGSGESPCLDCEACFRRFVALRSNGVGAARPSEAVIRSYGLQRLHGSPLATVHATLLALHSSGTPVRAVELADLEGGAAAEDGCLRVVFTSRRGAAPELIQRTLASNGIPFDAVVVGVSRDFFSDMAF